MSVSSQAPTSIEATMAVARRLRVDSIRATTAAGSGHPTSALSAADIVAVLLARHFRYDLASPARIDNDRFVLSKGHAAPVLYAALAAFGLIDRNQLTTLRAAGSQLEGHPVPGIPLVDVATGSLGQGLSNGLGMAIGQRMLGADSRTWVLLGDSEMAEGSVWEAVELAGHRGVGNLVAIVDMNRLGQRGPTMYGWDAAAYRQRAEASGWATIEIDGHDHEAIDDALSAAADSEVPTLVVARTMKGKGVSFAEDAPGRHGKPFDAEEAERALDEIGTPDVGTWTFAAVPAGDPPPSITTDDDRRPIDPFEDAVATRDAFGAALEARVTNTGSIVVIDGEVGDSTRTQAVRERAPNRFIQAYIAEQNMVGMASGLQALGCHPVVATFGAFFTRAHDFVRMAQIGGATMTLVGSHAGVSIGEDGPSQMALDDLAMMRAAGALVLYPADGNATVALLDLALNHDGLSYLRTTRGDTPHVYPVHTSFAVGGCHVHHRSGADRATIVAAGVTVFEALEAADRLADVGIATRVVDAYSVAPLDTATLAACLEETGAMVVVEDHGRPGGLGEAVAMALSGGNGSGNPIVSLAVDGVPGSATPDEQRRLAGIDAAAIVAAVKDLLDGT